ncbi:hypothetical protein HOK00_05305 [bacterium]|jgi:hypothetical protein|nr:hypothetical protein [bacterium]
MKVYATYLPGFHNDKLNNKWWGNNFSEWDIVKKAKPLFLDHNQPSVPLNGYYDLSSADAIQSQYKMAKKYGIDAFLMYGYWSKGQQPLVKPFEVILDNPDLDIKFAYYWGNHSWTRTWTNRKGSLDVLLEQEYDSEDMDNFFLFLVKLFKDVRYERIDGKPLFIIYKPEDIPNLKEFIIRLKSYSYKYIGVEPYIIGSITAWKNSYDWIDLVDSTMLFQPSFSLFGPENVFENKKESVANKINQYIRSLPDGLKKYIYYMHDLLPEKYTIYDFTKVANKSLHQFINFRNKYINSIPMINIGFDNTPRYKGRAKIIESFNIEEFKNILSEIINITKYDKNNIIVINAWNEWGEGMYLEPDEKSGYIKLEAVRSVLND